MLAADSALVWVQAEGLGLRVTTSNPMSRGIFFMVISFVSRSLVLT